jgi:hypothetical protein
LWFSLAEAEGLDAEKVAAAPGTPLCAHHGAAKLGDCFRGMAEANLEYVNLPYGESGAYVWF